MDETFWSVILGQGLGNLELGAERALILQRLGENELEYDAEDDDPLHVIVPDCEMQLTFRGETSPRLVQIAVEDEQVRFGTEPVLRRRLHEITNLLQVNAEETVWRVDDDPDDSLPGNPLPSVQTVSDRDLLYRGTLWIQPLGLGLRLWRGEISDVFLRLPEDVPQEGVGRLTPIQVDITKQPDLAFELDRLAHAAAQMRRWFRLVTGILFFASIAVVVWQATSYQRRWHEAPAAQGQVIATGPGGPDTIATDFTVSYRDQDGVEHQTNLGLADVHVPKVVGDSVELKYLPEKPDEPLGPGRVHDAAFIKYFPWGIGVLAGYLVVQIAGAIVFKLLSPRTRLST